MQSHADKLRFFASGYTSSPSDPGIYVFDFYPAPKTVDRVDAKAGAQSPSFIELDEGVVYAASETPDCARLASYRIEEGSPRYLGKCEFGDASGTCFVLADPKKRCLYGANYDSGSICSCSLNSDGSPGEPFPLVQHFGTGFARKSNDPNYGRQSSPHVHTLSFVPHTNLLAAVDLGLDGIYLYKTNEHGQIEPHTETFVEMPAGSGPRIVAYHPQLPLAAVVCELSCEALIYQIDESGLNWKLKNKIDLLETNADRPLSSTPPLAAHAEFSKDGKFLYVSTRGIDIITILALNDSGNVISRADQYCGGSIPRHFALSPDNRFLAVANQQDDAVTIFERDTHTGKLSEVTKAECDQPSCVAWVS